MSYLARIAERAGLPGGGLTEPLLVPKDRGLQHAPRLSRQEGPPEDEEVQTLRRQLETGSDDEEVQTLRRQVEGTDAARAPIVGSTAAEQEVPLATRRIDRMAGEQQQEEAAAAPPVRRIAEDPEDAQAARPLHHSAVVRRSVRSAPASAPRELGPDTSPASEIFADEPEPSNLRAPPPTAQGAPPAPVPAADHPDHLSRRSEAPMAVLPPQPVAEARAAPPAGNFERPQVVIDRLDVLIHEPTPPTPGPNVAGRRARALRARYLRRL